MYLCMYSMYVRIFICKYVFTYTYLNMLCASHALRLRLQIIPDRKPGQMWLCCERTVRVVEQSVISHWFGVFPAKGRA
jgi:hypothetical protein